MRPVGFWVPEWLQVTDTISQHSTWEKCGGNSRGVFFRFLFACREWETALCEDERDLRRWRGLAMVRAKYESVVSD